MALRKNANVENEKNGFSENSSQDDSSQQLEWSGAGELPPGASYVTLLSCLSRRAHADYRFLFRTLSRSILPILLNVVIDSVNAEGVPTYMGATGSKLTWLITIAASAGFGLFG
jgi:hypothetical protein